jgi:hypothetical protein
MSFEFMRIWEEISRRGIEEVMLGLHVFNAFADDLDERIGAKRIGAIGEEHA